MILHKRNLYLERIRPYIGTPVVKVITGMRRVGKSCFLRNLMDEFSGRSGTGPLVAVDRESLEFDFIRDYRDLEGYVKEKAPAGPAVLLVDEIQEIEGWERCIASLLGEGRFDIYISGSNAGMLSSELATLLSGRYIEFPIYSLGFAEFLEFHGLAAEASPAAFADYLRYGGLPALAHFELDQEVVYQYIQALYHTILLKDVVKRHQVRNIALLESVVRYVFDNLGNIFSAKRVSDFLKSQRMSLGVETVHNYLAYLCSTFVLYRVPRYDIRGKRLLSMHEKYFLGDIGLRHALLGYRESDISGLLENIVFLELKRRGYTVYIGKQGDLEIDFIASRAGERIFIQVAYLLASPGTVEREFAPLLAIRDNYPKYVLSMDSFLGGDHQGVKWMNLMEFLLRP